MSAREYNFDGIVGPTHNFAGLSYGNVASSSNQNKSSSPRRAALQGLAKMKFVAELGIPQCVLPPLLRPNIRLLHQLGFRGSDSAILEAAYQADPVFVAACYSASNMWSANAAMVSPSADTADGRLHLTPANLASTLHRSIEPPETTRVLRAIFSNESAFVVHDPLLACDTLADEGAANHTRLTLNHGQAGIELFVYGRKAMDRASIRPSRFPARQTIESCQAIARRHNLSPERTVFMQQNPAAIDAGVFHNDVISVGNENVLLVHESAFLDQPNGFAELRTAFEREFDSTLYVIEFAMKELSLADAVSSYFFNSQLVTRPDGGMTMVCPLDAKENENSFRATQRLLSENNPVDSVEFLDLRQSMNNGGGPACLRLRVVMNETEQLAFHQGVRFTTSLHDKLVSWVESNYRDELSPDDLRDPSLLDETSRAAESLCDILGLPRTTLIQ